MCVVVNSNYLISCHNTIINTVKLENKSRLGRISTWIFIGLLAYMPLHIFLSTWLGTSFGVLSFAKVAKDAVMLIGAATAGLIYLKNHKLADLWKDGLFKLIAAYVALNVLLAIFKPTDNDAELLGVLYNTRFLVFFVYDWLLTKIVDPQLVRKYALRAVFVSAFVVLVFGLMQKVVLPGDVFTNFGYSRENGVLPAFYIDDKADLPRVMSTLRDPNSFGSYVVIVGSLAAAVLLSKPRLRRFAKGLLILSGLCLWFSFSRSAWLGLLAAAAVFYWAKSKDKIVERAKKHLVFLIFAIVSTGFLFYVWQNSYFVQNVVFHADQSTALEDPNQLRTRFWRESMSDIADNPLGQGPGTAGLASIRNETQGTTLNENYYLQIATELGVLGILLFGAIIWNMGQKLRKLAGKDWLALALFASFIGLLVTNFLVHIWSNEAVAYTWWGLASVVILNNNVAKVKK